MCTCTAHYPNTETLGEGGGGLILWRSPTTAASPTARRATDFPQPEDSAERSGASVISVISQKRRVISKCTLVPVERLDKAAKSITAAQQRYTPLPGIDSGPRPAQLPANTGPITNSPAAEIINSNVIIWPGISRPARGVTKERCPARCREAVKACAPCCCPRTRRVAALQRHILQQPLNPAKNDHVSD